MVLFGAVTIRWYANYGEWLAKGSGHFDISDGRGAFSDSNPAWSPRPLREVDRLPQILGVILTLVPSLALYRFFGLNILEGGRKIVESEAFGPVIRFAVRLVEALGA